MADELQEFTLHLNFLASDVDQAADHAEAYAEALNLLRGEVDSYTVTISPFSNWRIRTNVFCGIPGPSPFDVCTRRVHQPGEKHRGPTGVWEDDQVPRAPDTPEGI